ncbi:polymer-forming cytoskeletal protein [Alphaproteobacteria bacterium]|nr:polymer-forming cytoskeletal protein [Alphaproteobacteria bacterium]
MIFPNIVHIGPFICLYQSIGDVIVENVDKEFDNSIEEKISNDDGIVVIGEGVELEGRINDAKDTNIAGNYNGSIVSENILVSKQGQLKGDIKTQDITIDGRFTGDLKADNNLTINNSGKVKGNFEYSTLEVRFGATIEGMVKHTGSMSSFVQSDQSGPINGEENLSNTQSLNDQEEDIT